MSIGSAGLCYSSDYQRDGKHVYYLAFGRFKGDDMSVATFRSRTSHIVTPLIRDTRPNASRFAQVTSKYVADCPFQTTLVHPKSNLAHLMYLLLALRILLHVESADRCAIRCSPPFRMLCYLNARIRLCSCAACICWNRESLLVRLKLGLERKLVVKEMSRMFVSSHTNQYMGLQ